MAEPKANEIRCPHCGNPVPVIRTPKSMLVAIFLAPIVAGMLLLAAYAKTAKDPVFEETQSRLLSLLSAHRYEDAARFLDEVDPAVRDRRAEWVAERKSEVAGRIKRRDERLAAALAAATAPAEAAPPDHERAIEGLRMLMADAEVQASRAAIDGVQRALERAVKRREDEAAVAWKVREKEVDQAVSQRLEFDEGVRLCEDFARRFAGSRAAALAQAKRAEVEKARRSTQEDELRALEKMHDAMREKAREK